MKSHVQMRQRGFICSSCQEVTMVFGQDPVPHACSACAAQGTLSKKWDNLITSETTVSKYVESESQG